MDEMNYSVIIPNFNGESILKKSFQTVTAALEDFASANNLCELIYIDDASRDASITVLERLKTDYTHPYISVEVLSNKKNRGFSYTVNTGVDQARGDILILLNTDVSPQKDFLKPLLGHFMKQDVFAVGCLDKSIEGENVVERGRGVGRFKRGFLNHARGEVNKTDTLWASAGSGAFRKDLWITLGGLQELYSPFYWEDIDLSYRALKTGYTVLFEPKSIVTHEHEKGAIKQTRSSDTIKKIAYRNQVIFVWLNITDAKYIAEHIAWLPYHIVTTLLHGDFAFSKGVLMAMIKLRFVLRERRKNRRRFVRTDSEVLAQYTS